MSQATIPRTMRAFVQNNGPEMSASVKDHPVPTLEDNEVLIKVHYAAQNPTDWKHSEFYSPPGAIIGCDFSGEIVQLGKKLTNPSLKVGDKVAGCVHGGLFKDKGSYAEYAKQESDLVFKVPEGLSLDDAATFGVGWVTACQALIEDQHRPWPPAKQNEYFLVYGASTSVGLFAVPLAKSMGYKVIAICSPHSFDLAKSFGADYTVDYHDGDKCAEEVRKISGGGVRIGLDNISENGSVEVSLAGFAAGKEGEKGRLNMLLPPSKEHKAIRHDVELSQRMMYTLFGKRFTMTPADPNGHWFEASAKDRQFGADIMTRTPELIEKYGIKANPVDLRGGLDSIAQGFADMKANKVSGKKLVYKIIQ